MKNSKSIISISLVVSMLLFSIISVFANVSTSKNELVLMIGSSQNIFNSKTSLIDDKTPALSPEIIDGKAYVPKSFLEEKFNIKIDLNKVGATVINALSLVSVRDVADNYNLKVFFNDDVIVLTDNSSMSAPTSEKISSYKKELSSLPKIGTKENLIALLGQDTENDERMYKSFEMGGNLEFASEPEAMESTAEAPLSTASGIVSEKKASDSFKDDSASGDFSETNTQVKGVDEGDIIKTDGKYIYYANANKINIVKATPADSMEVLAKIEYSLEDNVIEMFLGDNQLIVITSSHDNSEIEKTIGDDVRILDYSYGKQVVKTYIYNISDIKNPKEVKSFSIDGNFNTARKVDSELYVITSNYINYNYNSKEYALPVLKDSSVNKDVVVGYSGISYFPESLNYQLTNIVGAKLDELSKPVSIESYLGGSENFYMSTDNLYIVTTSYNYHINSSNNYMNYTNIYKYALDKGSVKFESKGRVEGNVLNQFSMDEHNSYFRIATTTNSRTNNLFVLNKTLNKVGEVKNIAPGETIRSVRFMGNKAYMVTFEVTDPLFVIDLTDPQKPAILGELKIPGYSTYLHPYDENHLIGFGVDTVEVDGRAYNRGMKVSMFDVSDLNNPKEKFQTIIGDRGTSSPLLYNHKALLFDKEKNILAFPIDVYMIESGKKNDIFEYGTMKFQGAYVYSIDINSGFNLREKITHVENDDIYDYDNYINRIIYIGENLYTVSNNAIKTNNLIDMKPTGSIKLK